jgi:hypothetical protein
MPDAWGEEERIRGGELLWLAWGLLIPKRK